MQITDLKTEEKILPLFRLGFRPFFLFGAAFSFIALFIWMFILKGNQTFSPLGGGYWWHIHEMIFGFGGAIIAGFLLTAVQNWTGIRGAQGNTLIVLLVIWLLGRLALLFPSIFTSTFAIIIDLAFLPSVAYVLGKPIIAIKQYRNLFFVPLLFIFTIANVEMYLSLYFPDTVSQQLSGYAGVMLVTFLMSVMAGRVTPMFTANGTRTTKVDAKPLLEKCASGSIAVSVLLLLLHPIIGFNPIIFGSIVIFAGIAQAIRWFRWRPWVTLSVPLLWSLHISLKFVWVGLILLGITYLLPKVPSNHIWHLLTVGGMGGIILAMISRVSLGHTGRSLVPPKVMSAAFISITLAALVRVFGPIVMPELTIMMYSISVLLWFIAFAAFVALYGPMLLKPRADGRPG